MVKISETLRLYPTEVVAVYTETLTLAEKEMGRKPGTWIVFRGGAEVVTSTPYKEVLRKIGWIMVDEEEAS